MDAGNKLEIWIDPEVRSVFDSYMVFRLEEIIEKVAAIAVTPSDLILIEACHRVLNYLHEI
jgi:cupin superfamily acireductone dioxygenase involved in methionine salvage